MFGPEKQRADSPCLRGCFAKPCPPIPRIDNEPARAPHPLHVSQDAFLGLSAPLDLHGGYQSDDGIRTFISHQFTKIRQTHPLKNLSRMPGHLPAKSKHSSATSPGGLSVAPLLFDILSLLSTSYTSVWRLSSMFLPGFHQLKDRFLNLMRCTLAISSPLFLFSPV